MRLVTGYRLPVTRKKIFCVFVFFCILLSLFCLLISRAHAQELPTKEPIVVNGDKVEYLHDKKQVVGTGNISITFKDVELTCDKVTVYLDTREAIAEGNVKVAQMGAYFTGERMNYNFDTKKGTVLKGYLSAKPFYGKADEVDKLADKEQYNLERGYVTTCDLEKPHYRLQARQVRVYLDDKVVAKHITFLINNVPVLYWPYYIQSLKDTKSHVTVIPGQSKEWGYYALMAYRYNLSDNNKGDILLDYRSKKGLGEGINHYYNTKEVGDGAFKVYYTHENDMLAFERTGETKLRYRYQWRHKWDLGEGTDTLATAEFNKLSDRDVIKDYFYNEYQEIGDRPDNYISFLTQKEEYTTELLIRKSFNKFLEVVERLPEYRIDIPNFRFFKAIPLYYQARATGVYLNKTFNQTTNPGQKDIDVVRFDVYNQLSYAAKILNALNVTPYVGTEDTYYSRNMWGDTNLIRTLLKAGVDNSIKFYRIYDVETNFLGLDINKLRHIITPTANYYFTHQPTISPENLNQFDDIDAVTAQNGIRLALENRLQTKRLEDGQMKSVDLATLIISTDYLFRLKKNNWNIKEDTLNNIEFQLELIPYSWAYIVSKMTVNTKKSTIQSLGTDLVANGGEQWQLALGHRYENTPTGSTNLFTLDGAYRINEKWKIRAYERLNVQKRYIEEQEYTITRDLHCWIGELTYNIKDSGNHTLWFMLRLKAFPEYPIGLKRTYSRPRFGSTSDTVTPY